MKNEWFECASIFICRVAVSDAVAPFILVNTNGIFVFQKSTPGAECAVGTYLVNVYGVMHLNARSRVQRCMYMSEV